MEHKSLMRCLYVSPACGPVRQTRGRFFRRAFCLALMLAAAAALFSSCGVRHEDFFDPQQEGLVLVKTADGQKTACTALAPGKRYRKTEPFEPDAMDVYTIPNSCFTFSDNRVAYIRPADAGGHDAPVTREINDICQAMRFIDHDVIGLRIFRVGGEWFASAMLNVNLWTPYRFYYYNPDTRKLQWLTTFADEDVEAVQILSAEKLRALDQESIGGAPDTTAPEQLLADQPELFERAAAALLAHADLFDEIETQWWLHRAIGPLEFYDFDDLNPFSVFDPSAGKYGEYRPARAAGLTDGEEKALLALTDRLLPYRITHVRGADGGCSALVFEYFVFNEAENRSDLTALIRLAEDGDADSTLERLRPAYADLAHAARAGWMIARGRANPDPLEPFDRIPDQTQP